MPVTLTVLRKQRELYECKGIETTGPAAVVRSGGESGSRYGQQECGCGSPSSKDSKGWIGALAFHRLADSNHTSNSIFRPIANDATEKHLTDSVVNEPAVHSKLGYC